MSISRKVSLVLAIVFALGLASVAFAQAAPTVQVADNAALGQILTDAKGMTLYMYTKDTPGTSNCYNGCATAWPPLTVAQGTTPTAGQGATGKLATTTRTDGTIQVTYNDMPLYYFAKDKAAGDVTGQNVGSVWFVINPTTGPVKTALEAATPAAGATPSAPAAVTTAPAAAAQAAATTAPTAAATAPAPATMPTTGSNATALALPLVALAVALLSGGLALRRVRRS